MLKLSVASVYLRQVRGNPKDAVNDNECHYIKLGVGINQLKEVSMVVHWLNDQFKVRLLPNLNKQ